MNFNSFVFLIFMTIIFFAYWKIPNKYRWILLLVASCYFYAGYGIGYLLLLGIVILISYLTGLLIHRSKSDRMKKIILIGMVAFFVALLAYFKYASFLLESINSFFSIFSIQLHSVTAKIALPVGISFYSFKALSYLIDIYRGEKPEENLGKYATYVAFFPEVSSGPIDRAGNLLPQISKEHHFQYEKVTYGLKQVAWGLFKKMVVADTLAYFVDWIYGSLYSYEGFTLLLISVFFTIQIYCDFSGYSDMAIGLSKMLDIDLMENFRSPYFATSVKDFWRRWHISLSSWFRDYVYIPLGGNRCKGIRHGFNLFITFLISGLWHGADWTFIMWGGLHGLAQIVENVFQKKFTSKKEKKAWKNVVSTLVVFAFCNFAWIFFRADSMEQVIYFYTHMFQGISNPITFIAQAQKDLIIDVYLFGKIMSMIMLVFAFDFISLKKDAIAFIGEQKTLVRWSVYCFFVFIMFIFMPVELRTEFLYFQF